MTLQLSKHLPSPPRAALLAVYPVETRSYIVWHRPCSARASFHASGCGMNVQGHVQGEAAVSLQLLRSTSQAGVIGTSQETLAQLWEQHESILIPSKWREPAKDRLLLLLLYLLLSDSYRISRITVWFRRNHILELEKGLDITGLHLSVSHYQRTVSNQWTQVRTSGWTAYHFIRVSFLTKSENEGKFSGDGMGVGGAALQ